MTDAESPATVFELLYLFFPLKRRKTVYDNACHLMDFSLNRAPEWTELMQPLIDAFHASGHTSCARSFNTGHASLYGSCVPDGSYVWIYSDPLGISAIKQ